jgi:hypothetical protein
MTDFSLEGLRAAGFSGFLRFADLRVKLEAVVPTGPGVYVLLRPDWNAPGFLATSTGGWYQGKNPSVVRARLEREWLAAEAVVYIGKADSLRERLDLYLRFGTGEPAFHYGGRLVWHLQNALDLLVGWREEADPWEVEGRLLAEFKERAGRYPFANLRGGRRR